MALRSRFNVKELLFKHPMRPTEIRNNFGKTWLFERVMLNHDNRSNIIERKTPDTMTTWSVNAVCLSKDGIQTSSIRKLSIQSIVAKVNWCC